MIRFASPFRYPGGKGALAEFLAELMMSQRPVCTTYIEPFAGGAGAAIRLLLDERVDEIILNDLDPGVAAFWRSVRNQPKELVELIRTTEVSVAEWYKKSHIYVEGSDDDLELGFATFFLNRTNRSGILRARPIGGLLQDGRWRIDARFNREELIQRIELISKYNSRITVSNLDGIDLLRGMLPLSDTTFVYVDPPYIDKGKDLYLNAMHWNDHIELSILLAESNARWMATYNCDERLLEDLYPMCRCARFSINHSAQTQHVGSEFAFFSSQLAISDLSNLSNSYAMFVR
jgi:DNA adenine methylase